MNTLHILYIDTADSPITHQWNNTLSRLLQRIEQWSWWYDIDMTIVVINNLTSITYVIHYLLLFLFTWNTQVIWYIQSRFKLHWD